MRSCGTHIRRRQHADRRIRPVHFPMPFIQRMLECQREGIAKAKAAGKYKGRAPTAKAKIHQSRALRSDAIGATEIALRLVIGRASVYRLLGSAA